MSHIPSSAMPHAKPHDAEEHGHEHNGQVPGTPEQDAKPAEQAKPAEPAPVATQPVPPTRDETTEPKPFPWLAIAIGGALAAGTAITVAILTRSPAEPPRKGGRKPNAAKSADTPRKPRRKKADAAE